MPAVKEYDAKIDIKRRVTLRGARFDHYHVKEYSDGRIELEPRELVEPFELSARTLAAMDEGMARLKAGEAGEAVDLSSFVAED